MRFGIIGYGAFGKLVADVLADFGEVLVFSKSQKEIYSPAKAASFEEAASCDVVVLAVGLNALEEVCQSLSGLVKNKTVVADVSSVKVKPIEIMRKTLGGKCRLIATHPLFGPQTVKDGSLEGESIVVCKVEGNDDKKAVEFFSNKLKLKVIEMSAEAHDKEIAWVHGLTFFVGRGLMGLEPPKSPLTTGYYQKLLDLVELESAHSIELFNTVERGNPYAADIRQRFIHGLQDIDKEIGK